MKLKTFLFLLVSSFTMFSAVASDASRDAIKDRIKPVGQIKIAGAQAETAEASGPRSGAEIYQASCFACHGTGAMNAPKKDDAAGWGPRLEKGMDVLLSNAINGFNAMPPMGTCSTCSDDDMQAAIDHMLEGI